MRVAIVFEPDPDLGPDPNDDARKPRRIGEFLDVDRDVIVIYREWGDEFDGGFRDHLFGQGIWENLTVEQFADMLAVAEELPELADGD